METQPIYSDRRNLVHLLESREDPWDVLIIGGGASGLGAAVDAATRGYSTLLLEQHDFAKGTSSRSTKLVHGGVRYLAQGNVSLVLEALRERGRLRRNAPHLVRDQAFVIPCYKWWCVPFYTIGLTLYDLMAGKLGIGRSLPLSRKRALRSLPAIRPEGLRGGVRYYDCQFDDARLAVNLVQTLFESGGTAVNYMMVTGLLKKEGKVAGVRVQDQESGRSLELEARVVINATGVFADQVLKMDNPAAREQVRPSQGIHLVLGPAFLKGEQALMIPRTSDGRVLFAVPWHGHVVVGTTDVEKQEASLEPVAEQEEVEYILETAGRFMNTPPGRGDILSVFTGLRPLAAPSEEGKKTKEISRGHRVLVSESGLVTLTGGKWTTYRKMGEDVVDRAVDIGGLPHKPCTTYQLRIHGYQELVDHDDPLYWYGADRSGIEKFVKERPELQEPLSEGLKISAVQLIWAIHREMARTVEDFLSRRVRALQLNARESLRMAPRVAELMARELGRDQAWEREQLAHFTRLTRQAMFTDPLQETG